MKQPHAYICKYRITKVTLCKHATWQLVAMYMQVGHAATSAIESLVSETPGG